jgi:integral membrane sensor domain MASE1
VPRTARQILVIGGQVLVVAVSYYLAAKIGLSLALVGGQVTPLWPPTGIALASLLVVGPRCWPGITVAAFLVNLPLGPTLASAVVITAGNTLAPVCAWLLLSRFGFRKDLRHLDDVLALIFLGALAGMLVSATVGAATLSVAGADFWSTWWVWWTGDAIGVLVVVPVVLVAATTRFPRRVRPARWVEAALLFATLVLVTWVAMHAGARLLFLVFPVLIWAASRFRQKGAAPGNLVVTVAAVLTAAAGEGPFAGMDLLPTMITLQAFNSSATLTALLLAAVTDERDEAQHSVHRAVHQLSEAVAALEPYRLLRNGLLHRVLHQRDDPRRHGQEPTSKR